MLKSIIIFLMFVFILKGRSLPTPDDSQNFNTENLKAKYSLTIKAMIDGKSILHIKNNKIWWENVCCARPGLHDGLNEPTYINNVAWYPKWKNEKLSYEETMNFQLDACKEIFVFVLRWRGNGEVISVKKGDCAFPLSELLLTFDDGPSPSHYWYEVILNYNLSKTEKEDLKKICRSVGQYLYGDVCYIQSEKSEASSSSSVCLPGQDCNTAGALPTPQCGNELKVGSVFDFFNNDMCLPGQHCNKELYYSYNTVEQIIEKKLEQCRKDPKSCGIDALPIVRTKTDPKVVARKIANKTFWINGYYIHYGPDQFDWLYISNFKNVYKLEKGVKEDYSLRWTPVHNELDPLLEGVFLLDNRRIQFGRMKE